MANTIYCVQLIAIHAGRSAPSHSTPTRKWRECVKQKRFATSGTCTHGPTEINRVNAFSLSMCRNGCNVPTFNKRGESGERENKKRTICFQIIGNKIHVAYPL